MVVEPRIAPGDQTPGPLTEVRAIAGAAYAVGTLPQAYVRDGPGRWRRIDQTCRASGPDAADFAFRPSMDSRRWTSMPGAGRAKLALRRQVVPRRYRPILLSIAYAAAAMVGLRRGRGLILCGRGDRWLFVFHEAAEEDLWSCEWFQDRLYVATTHVLYKLHGDDLVPLDYGDLLPPATCYHLGAADGVMWSIGAQDICQLDQTGWSRII